MAKDIERVCNGNLSETSDISAKLGLPKSTKITEQWVVHDVIEKCGSGKCDSYDDYVALANKYTILVIGTMGIDTSDAEAIITEKGIAKYINMRMREAENQLRYVTIQGEDSELTIKQAIEILKTLRAIDYKNRTSEEEMPVIENHSFQDDGKTLERTVHRHQNPKQHITYFKFDGERIPYIPPKDKK